MSQMFGYPLTFAGSSVVQSETLFVFVRCVTNNKRPLLWPKYARVCHAFSFPPNGAQPMQRARVGHASLKSWGINADNTI